MKRIIYGKKSSREGANIYVNEFDFKPPPVDSDFINMSIDALNRLCRTEFEGRKVYESFMYMEIPIWWFCYSRLTSYFISTISFIHNFIRFVDECSPDEVRVEGDFSKMVLIQQICARKKIRFSLSSLQYSRFKIVERSRKTGKRHATSIATRKKIHRRLKLFDNLELPPITDRILLASYPTYRRHLYNPHTRRSDMGEFIIGEIAEMLGSAKNLAGIDLFTKIMTDDHVLEERLAEDIPWFPAEALFSHGPEPQHSRFLHNFDKVIESGPFLDLFEFEGVKFGRHALPFLQEFRMDCYLPYWLNLIDSFYETFSDSRPRAVFMIFETAPPSLALISVCRKLGIKTVGLQHGVIHNAHYLYMHDETYSSVRRNGFILPDHLLLFGEITRNYLLDRGYPEDVLTSFGNISFLNIMGTKVHRADILKNHHLDASKKIILFAPPGLVDFTKSDQNYNQTILEELLAGMPEDYFLVVKPHPADDPSFYSRIISHSGSTQAKVITTNIVELLSISEILVSTFSTTMIDAMCLDVPVVQVLMPDVHYARPYDGFDAVLSTRLEDLSTSVGNLLYNKEMQEELCRHGQRFVKQYYNLPIKDPKSVLEKVLSD